MALRRYPEALDAYLACRQSEARLLTAREEERNAVRKLVEEEARDLRRITALITQRRISWASEGTLLRYQERLRFVEESRWNVTGTDGPLVSPELSLALGSAYFRLGRLAEAEGEYRGALRVRPSLGAARNNLAAVLMQTRRLVEAEGELRRAEESGFPVDPRFRRDLRARIEAAAGR